METIIIEFLLGTIVGTLSGLLIVKHTGSRTLSRKASSPRRLKASKQITVPKLAKTRKGGRSLHRPRRKSVSQPIQTLNVDTTSTPEQRTIVASCPSCGLQAPPSLMAEHFLGSPSHEQGPLPIDPPVSTTSANEEHAALVAEEDPRNSLRHLLQMLVPPRAFGRRHAEKTVNPLSRLVQTIEESRNSLVRPLKGP